MTWTPAHLDALRAKGLRVHAGASPKLAKEAAIGPTPKRNKYGAQRTEYGGRVYDSKAEAARAFELEMLLKAGKIKAVKRQVEIELVAGICIRLDHVWTDNQDVIHYEDTKGGHATETAVFKIKRKLFEHFHKPAKIEIDRR